MPYDAPDGPMIVPSGPGVVRASRFQPPERAQEPPMKDISGRSGSISSGRAGPLSSSASKSPALPLSGRRCKGCEKEKPLSEFRLHNRGGRRWTCRVCENAWVRTTKPWSGTAKRDYQRSRRLTVRGFALAIDAKNRAKTKGIPFSLDWREIQRKIEAGFCEVTGLPFSLTKTRRTWDAPSLDQIKPGLGYTPENTRVVLYALNMMIGTWGLETMLKVAAAVKGR